MVFPWYSHEIPIIFAMVSTPPDDYPHVSWSNHRWMVKNHCYGGLPNGRPGRPCAEAAMEAQGSTYRGAEPAMVAELDVSDVGHRYVLL